MKSLFRSFKLIFLFVVNKFHLLFFLLLIPLVLNACAPVANAYVQMNPDLQIWINIGVTFVVAYLLMQLAAIPQLKWLSDYLGQYKTPIIAWLSGVIIQVIQLNILDKIPSAWDNVAAIVMELIVAVLVTLYGFRKLQDRGVRAFL